MARRPPRSCLGFVALLLAACVGGPLRVPGSGPLPRPPADLLEARLDVPVRSTEGLSITFSHPSWPAHLTWRVPVAGLTKTSPQDGSMTVDVLDEELDHPERGRHVVAHELWHVLTSCQPDHLDDIRCFSYRSLGWPVLAPCPEEVRLAREYSVGVVYRLRLEPGDARLRSAAEWAVGLWNAALGRRALEIAQ